jgi:TRAP-type C4-dicarboxylate transport system permease small subunit
MQMRLSGALSTLANLANIGALVFMVWTYYHPNIEPGIERSRAIGQPPNAGMAFRLTGLEVIRLAWPAVALVVGGALNLSAFFLKRRELRSEAATRLQSLEAAVGTLQQEREEIRAALSSESLN